MIGIYNVPSQIRTSWSINKSGCRPWDLTRNHKSWSVMHWKNSSAGQSSVYNHEDWSSDPSTGVRSQAPVLADNFSLESGGDKEDWWDLLVSSLRKQKHRYRESQGETLCPKVLSREWERRTPNAFFCSPQVQTYTPIQMCMHMRAHTHTNVKRGREGERGSQHITVKTRFQPSYELHTFCYLAE